MNELYKQDVFFFITSIAVVLLTILLAVLAIYLIKISRDIKHIVRRAKSETDLLAEDLDDLRANLRAQRFGLKAFAAFFSRLASRRKKRD